MKSKRPGAIKTTIRAAQGGVVAVIALIALMFLRGGGSGSGDAQTSPSAPTGTPGQTLVSARSASGTKSPTDVPRPSNSSAIESADGTAADGMAPDGAADAASGLTADERRALSGQVLGVLIDEYSYLLEVPGDSQTIFQPVPLARVVELAERAAGDTNGIRVRILRRESSRTRAEEDLKAALANAGIGAEAVYMPADFVP